MTGRQSYTQQVLEIHGALVADENFSTIERSSKTDYITRVFNRERNMISSVRE